MCLHYTCSLGSALWYSSAAVTLCIPSPRTRVYLRSARWVFVWVTNRNIPCSLYARHSYHHVSCVGGVYEYGITVSRYEVQQARTPHNKWTEYTNGTHIKSNNSSSNCSFTAIFDSSDRRQSREILYHVSTRYVCDTVPESVVCPYKVREQDLSPTVKCILSKWYGGAARPLFCMN